CLPFSMLLPLCLPSLLFILATARTEIYTLSLHDALPICDVYHDRSSDRAQSNWPNVSKCRLTAFKAHKGPIRTQSLLEGEERIRDRKSTRLNSSHVKISYAVFCLKKKKPHHLRA